MRTISQVKKNSRTMTKTYVMQDGSTFKVTAKNKRKSHKWGQEHYAYTIVLVRNGMRLTFPFHDSAYNMARGKGADEQMLNQAMDAILLDYDAYDYNRTIDEFIEEFGYDREDMAKVSKIYNECMETYFNLNKLFTTEEMNEINEMIH